MSNPSQRILIYRLGSLGDTVVALPALRLVARAFPGAERWVLTNFSVSAKAAPMAAVLEGTGLVHGYVEYPIGQRDPRALLALRARLRALGANTLVYLAEPRGRLRAVRDAVFFRGCGFTQLVGVPYALDQQQPRRLQNGLYEYKGAHLARCIAALGDARLDDPASYELTLSPQDVAQAEAVLAPLAGRPLIAASVGAKVDTNDWEDERWRPLLAQLSTRYPEHGLVLVGSADERARCDELSQAWAGRVVNLCGRLSLRASGAALARCRVFIGHDSGPMHLAAAVGTRCVAIFSSRNLPGEWFPHGLAHRVLYHEIECQGCRLEECSARAKACIRSITVDEVLSATDFALTAWT
jgi:ADP-heptose:LPS heptosyltransferase